MQYNIIKNLKNKDSYKSYSCKFAKYDEKWRQRFNKFNSIKIIEEF